MSTNDIPLDKAELLSVLLEALLYGFSLLMFGATIWMLVFRRFTDRVNRKMFVVACTLLICSTAHVVGHIIRVMDGLILYRDTYHEGPVDYFADISQWTFNFKNYICTIQMLIGDGVILYRCYIVWQSKVMMIFPALLWFAAGLTGFMGCYTSLNTTQDGVFGGTVSQWMMSFWATSLAANLLTTSLLAYRLWYVDRKARMLHGCQQSQLRPMFHIIVDAGAIYSLTLLTGLICFLTQSNVQYVILDMVTPIISITFYMVIIHVGLAAGTSRTISSPLENSVDNRLSTEMRRRMQVHITTLTENKVESRQYPQMYLMTSATGKRFPSDMELSNEGEV